MCDDKCGACTEKGILKGWVCPVCGAGVSPYVTFCTHCVGVTAPMPPYYVPYAPGSPQIWPYGVTCGL